MRSSWTSSIDGWRWWRTIVKLNITDLDVEPDWVGIDTQLTKEICRRQPHLDPVVVYKLVSDLHYEYFL
jgi:hypothetical protein